MSLVKPSLQKFISIPEILQFHYDHNPAQPMYILGGEGEYVTQITYLEYVRSCHRAAHLLRPQRSGPDGAVVGLVALLDNHVYQSIHGGLIHAGLVPLLISPRLTPAAVLNLLKASGAHRLLITQTTLVELLQGVKELAASSEYEVTFEEAPSLEQVYPKHGTEKADDPFQPYPKASSYPSPDQICSYLHSSGSTGLPKAIPLTYRNMFYSHQPTVSAYATYHKPLRLGAMMLPPFHLMALTSQILIPLFGAVQIGLFPATVTRPDALPVMTTPDSILKSCERTTSNALVVVPAILQFYSQNPAHVEFLKSLEAVTYAGGPLPPATGDYLVSSGVRLNVVYGSTEIGLPPSLDLEGGFEDWAWLDFGTDKPYIRWASLGDGSSELQILTTDTFRPSIENLEDVRGYATSDIFEPHPTKPGLWKITGRTDDVIIHSSGEKTVPLPMEHVVIRSPIINGAVMFGRQRDQAGFLIEPIPEHEIDVTDEAQVSRFRNLIWPVIEQANKIAPTFSRVYKEMILITSKDKPLPRAAKGTVMRKPAYKEYEKEINQIYEAVEASASGGSVPPPTTWDVQTVQEWIKTQVTELSGNNLDVATDFFDHGLDSLSATILRLRLSGALRGSEDASIQAAAQRIDQNAIFGHPTVESLANFVIGLVHNSGEGAEESHEVLIERMIEQYSQGLEVTPQYRVDSTQKRVVVLLTGSTGNLGAQMLASLLANDSVAQVFTLNRPSTRTSILDRHKERFLDKALDVGLLSSEKLILLEGELSQPKLGLSDDQYNKLLGNVTIIIHNAWRLDFNLALSSFEPHVRGTRNLIDLGRSSRHASSLRFLYTSSITAVQFWDTKSMGGPHPEQIGSSKLAMGGYGQSKYVSEKLLEKSGLHVSILRIGQISGGKPNGAWATSDWFPMMVKSSLALGVLPNAHGVVSWAPMDAVAEAILDVALTTDQLPLVVNLVHPFPASWTSMIEAVRKAVVSAKKLHSDALPLVSLQEWSVSLQKQSTATGKSATEIPASKILGFIQALAQGDKMVEKNGDDSVETAGIPSLVTTNACRLSARMRNLDPIGISDAEMWVKYWIQQGF